MNIDWFYKSDEIIKVPANEISKAHLIHRPNAVGRNDYVIQEHISGHLWKDTPINIMNGNKWCRAFTKYRERFGNGDWHTFSIIPGGQR